MKKMRVTADIDYFDKYFDLQERYRKLWENTMGVLHEMAGKFAEADSNVFFDEKEEAQTHINEGLALAHKTIENMVAETQQQIERIKESQE